MEGTTLLQGLNTCANMFFRKAYVTNLKLKEKENNLRVIKAIAKGNGGEPSTLSPMQIRQLLSVDIWGFKKGGK
jgi:hypothetical protein